MKKEIEVTAKSIEAAVELGAGQLGCPKENVTYEVLELPKKGFLGLGSSEAKIKVIRELSPAETAAAFLNKIICHMQIDAVPKIVGESETEVKIEIVGKNLGILIGYHGEILDSLQYLTFLAVNREMDDVSDSEKGEAVRISIDVENYRKKREDTLRGLAKKMADRVLKFGRPVTLEPMNPYERRIIHSTVQEIDGVTTYSIGQDNERKIVITKEGAPKQYQNSQQRGGSFTKPKTGAARN